MVTKTKGFLSLWIKIASSKCGFTTSGLTVGNSMLPMLLRLNIG